jgi:GAF domain-containing protein
MNPLQLMTAKALLETKASRVRLLLADASGRFLIAAESVRDGLRQTRNIKPDLDFQRSPEVLRVREANDIVTENDLAKEAASQGVLEDDDIKSRAAAPVILDERLVGVITFEQSREGRHWSVADVEAIKRAQRDTMTALAEKNRQLLLAKSTDLRDAAVQAILDRLRPAMKAQRCTFRQDVVPGYAFAVAFESRDQEVRSLYGDFTIVQSGQPVIEKMLEERKQVVQGDCSIASDDPVFHVMLKHYGGMRSQIVTPLIEDNKFLGALSVHDLRGTRTWTSDEMKLAHDATYLIAALFRLPIG